MITNRSRAAAAITASEIATTLITALGWMRAASISASGAGTSATAHAAFGAKAPHQHSLRALKSLPDDVPPVQPLASPSPPPAGGVTLGGALAATTRSSKSLGEGGKANERPAGTGRRARPHLRHDAERRRAVAGNLAEHAREGRDRAAALATGSGRDRGRLPDHVAR